MNVLVAVVFMSALSVGAQVAWKEIAKSTFVCSPNGTQPIICDVHFNTSILNLSCPSVFPGNNWIKVNHSATSLCENSTCTVNKWDDHRKGYKDLTVDDSGLYYCKNFSFDSSYLYVNVNVLAPPKLTNPLALCDNICRAPLILFGLSPFNITVSYTGFLPIWVRWKFNGSDFNCNLSNNNIICAHNFTAHSSQTITIVPGDRYKNAVGTFTAEVTNKYGTNTSSVMTSFSCDKTTLQFPQVVNVSELNFSAGNSLNYTCSMRAHAAVILPLLACYTQHKNQTFPEVVNHTDQCVQILNYGKPIRLSENRNISIHASNDADTCTVSIHFEKSNLTESDSGVAYCAFETDRPFNFAELKLTFQHKPKPTQNNVLITVVPSSAGGLLLCVLIIAAVVVSIWYYRKKRRGYSQGTSPPGLNVNQVVPEETSPLLPQAGNGSNINIRYLNPNDPQDRPNSCGISPQLSNIESLDGRSLSSHEGQIEDV